MFDKWETSAGAANDTQTGVAWEVCEEGGGDAVAIICDHKEAEARANLVAAAPELLAALKASLSCLGDNCGDVAAMALAAIAKAEGRT